MRRRAGLQIVTTLAVLGWLQLAAAHAQLREQPVRIMFPLAAGSASDTLARLMAERLAAVIGKPVIVENRTGAAGRLAVQAVKSAAPDGMTLFLGPMALMSVYPHFYTQLGYDPVADFEPVTQFATIEFAVGVANRVPAKTLREYVAWVKANAGEGSFSTPGTGTLAYLLGLKLAADNGIVLRHAAYRGSAPAIQDMVAGQLPMVLASTPEFIAQHKAGMIRVLATSTPQPFIPGLPLFEDEGFDSRATGSFPVWAPARTPAAILDQYNKILVEAVHLPELEAKLLAIGYQPTGTTRARLAELQKADSDLWGPIVKASGFSPEQ